MPNASTTHNQYRESKKREPNELVVRLSLSEEDSLSNPLLSYPAPPVRQQNSSKTLKSPQEIGGHQNGTHWNDADNRRSHDPRIVVPGCRRILTPYRPQTKSGVFRPNKGFCEPKRIKKGKGQSRISPSLGGRERVLKSCLKKATLSSNCNSRGRIRKIRLFPFGRLKPSVFGTRLPLSLCPTRLSIANRC